MGTLKNIILLIMFISSSFCGPLIVKQNKRECFYIKKAGEILQLISDKIRYRSITLYSILKEIKKDQNDIYFTDNILKNIDKDISFTENWTNSIRNDFNLPDEAKNILIEAGNVLGKSDSKTQVNILNEYISSLYKLSDDYKEKIKSKEKLYNSVGILIGAFLVIIFI